MGFSSFPLLPPMLIEQRIDAVVVQAPAKVNLFLEVLARRPDGYHEIATLMVAVSLYDTLVLTEDTSEGLQLQCDVPELPVGPANLVYQAAQLLRQRTGCRRRRTFAWKSASRWPLDSLAVRPTPRRPWRD